MKYSRLSLLIASSSLFLISQSSFAAAFQFYELGAPINGTAGVGQAAVASDASTVYFNPAGMAAIPDTQMLFGSQLSLPYINFTPNSATTIAGNNGGNSGSLTPGIGAFFVHSYSPQLKFGVSLTQPYGGSLNYNTHWVGRYIIQNMMFYTLNLNPAIAYQVNPWLSLGAGVAIEYAYLSETAALPVSATVDGQVTLKASNTSPGFNLGMFITPRPATKIGVAYRSQIIHNLLGNLNFLNITTTPSASTKMVMPANIIASISQDLTDHWVLLGELGWANWSSMNNSVLTVGGFSASTILNWNNTYRFGLGGQYRPNPAMTFQAGASYDSSPTNSSRRLPDLPFDRQIRLGIGMECAVSKAIKLGLSYEYMNLGSAAINDTSSNGVLSGNYSRNFVNVLQGSVNVSI